MKPLERIFFQACVMNIHKICIRNVIEVFGALGFPIKPLYYYLNKWSARGFYDYGIAIDLGWFEYDELTGEYKVMYENIIKKGGTE